MSQTPDPNDDIPYAQARPDVGQQKYPQYNQPQHAGGPPNPPQQNAMGTTGFIVSLVSLFLCGIPSIIGIVISALGLKKEPKGLAIAGLILGLLGVLELICFVIMTMAAYSTVQSATVAIQAMATKITIEQRAMDVFESWEESGEIPTQEEGDALLAGETDSAGEQILYETDGESFTLRGVGPDSIANTEDDVTAGPYNDLSQYEALKTATEEFDFEFEDMDIE